MITDYWNINFDWKQTNSTNRYLYLDTHVTVTSRVVKTFSDNDSSATNVFKQCGAIKENRLDSIFWQNINDTLKLNTIKYTLKQTVLNYVQYITQKVNNSSLEVVKLIEYSHDWLMEVLYVKMSCYSGFTFPPILKKKKI